MMTRNYQFILVMCLIATGILGCNRTGQVKDLKSIREASEIHGMKDESSSLAPPVQSYRLWHTFDQFDLRSFEFHGGFFDDRLKFYFSKDPGLHIANAEVDLIMLYFLDERLVKIRYHLVQDITESILDSLGLGLLETRYNAGKTILATNKTIGRLREYNREKGKEDEFSIVWDRQIIESSYRVDPNPSSLYKFDTITAHFVYIDQLKSYRNSLIRLENELRNKLVLSTEK